MWLRRFKPSQAHLRVATLAILIVMCTLVILSTVFPFPEGTWDFLSIGVRQKVSANPDWLTGWDYRQLITINGTTAGAQSNYTLEYRVYNNGNILDNTNAVGGYESNPVISCGAASAWDENIREQGNVLYEPSDTGKEYKILYTGWTGTDAHSQIGYAYSSNGISWTKHGVLTNVDYAQDPYWLKIGGTYYLYVEDYTGGAGATHNLRRYHSDNITGSWTNDGVVLEPGSGWEAFSVDSCIVFYEDSVWNMLYVGRNNPTFGELIGYANSTDGTTWNKYGANPVFIGSGATDDFDEAQVCSHDIVKIGSTYYMTYQGSKEDVGGWDDTGCGIASSLNLTYWTRCNQINKNRSTMFYWDGAEYIFSYSPTGDDDQGIYRGYPNGRGIADLGGYAQPDFDDVRFTASDGITELPHFRYAYTSNISADLFVNFISVAASPGSSSYYIYYGNSGASSTSNSTTTFLFWEDFETDLSQWTEVETGGTVALDSGTPFEGTYSAKLTTTSAAAVKMIREQTIADNISIHTMMYLGETNLYHYLYLTGDVSGDFGPYTAYRNTGYYGYRDSDWNDIQSYNALQWYDLEYRVDITNDVYDVWVDGNKVEDDLDFFGTNTLDDIRSTEFVNQTVSGTETWVDLVYITRGADPAPTFWRTGSEEPLSPEISNSPSSNDFGTLEVNTTSNTAINYFTITNTGNTAVDVTVYGTDATGGVDDTWDLDDSGTPGENVYALYAGLDDEDDTFDTIVKESGSTPYNTLVSDLAESGTQDWGLKIYMPTSLSGYDNQQMSATITLVASEAT